MREESTRQLNRAVVDDWKYQADFKQRRQQEEKLAENEAAYHEKQVSSTLFKYQEKQVDLTGFKGTLCLSKDISEVIYFLLFCQCDFL